MAESRRRATFGPRATSGAKGTSASLLGRGLLFPSPIDIVGQHISTRRFPEEDLHSAVLYWEQISCPTSNFINVTLPGEGLLISEGILSRPIHDMMSIIQSRSSIDTGTIGRLLLDNQIQEFAALEKSRPGFWCMTSQVPQFTERSPQFSAGRSALVELCGALPLPPAGTTIESILEFKAKRKSELQRLRAALDKAYVQISSAGDQEMALQVAVSELDKSIADLLKTSKEWWKKVQTSDTKTLVNLGLPLAGAALLGTTIQMPAVGAILGGVGAFLSIGQGINAKLKSDRSSPYWYAVQVSKAFK